MACCIYPFFDFEKTHSMNNEGIMIRKVKSTVKDTIDNLQSFLTQKGATIYARINQQTEVANAGQLIPPLEFLLFGNPKGGGPLMAGNPLVALDLPLRIIAWEDEDGQAWIAWNDSTYIEKRYGLKPGTASALQLENLINDVLL
jgi:uncharacterized protein (DUF302 family)